MNKYNKRYIKKGNYINYKPDSTAPYNFIPLNNIVISIESIPDFDKYYLDRYTGYIEILIETKTPLYIRDTLTSEEYTQKQKDKTYIKTSFFSPGCIYRIPGSSLRGMIRTMVEIMSFGKFGFFNDEKLYYRAVGDTSSLGINYRDKMVDSSKNYFPKFKAGILRKKGKNKYEIIPSKIICGTQLYKIDISSATSIILSEFDFTEIYFNPVLPQDHQHSKKKLRYAKISSISLTQDASHPYKGYIISSGSMNNKRMHWIINEADDTKQAIELDEELIRAYKNDKRRNAPYIIEKLKTTVEIPCFYLTDRKGKIIAFGHTGMFRIPYEKSISDHIPTVLKNSKIMDISEAIFGNENDHASRVFFEDAYLEDSSANILMETKHPKILSEPKPTCFQHYIEQNEYNLKNHPKNLAHYDSNNNIRGYKLYWHKSANNWFETNQNNIRQHSSQYTKITPIKEGIHFRGRIRFDNLSKVELGALLFALQLPDGCCHKLGMAKPLGLGSIKITPKLFLSDIKQRYTNLFSELEQGLSEGKIEDFKSEFENYILKRINENKKSLWEIDRMKELRKMLDFQNKPSDHKTTYLELNDFRERKVLPEPTDV